MWGQNLTYCLMTKEKAALIHTLMLLLTNTKLQRTFQYTRNLRNLNHCNYICSINVRQCSLSFQRTSSNFVHTRNMLGERPYSLPFGCRHPDAVERAVRAVNTGYSCSKNRLFMPSSTWHPTGSHMQAQGMPCGRRRDAIWGMPSAFRLYQLAVCPKDITMHILHTEKMLFQKINRKFHTSAQRCR